MTLGVTGTWKSNKLHLISKALTKIISILRPLKGICPVTQNVS